MSNKLVMDFKLDPYNVSPIRLRVAQQIENWGHIYSDLEDLYSVPRVADTVIVIIDTAGDFDHPDLTNQNLKEYNKVFVPNASPKDIHGHGTHCAGIAAAENNGIGIIGTDPEAKLIALKCLSDVGSGSSIWIGDAIRYITDLDMPYKKVISMSLGSDTPSDYLKDAIDYAMNNGVFVVAAAGNRGCPGIGSTVQYPGAFPRVICAGCIEEDEDICWFSSCGPELDVVSPGNHIYSTHRDGGYAFLSGTSMSTPLVAGMVSLIYSRYPDIDNQDDMQDYVRARAKDLEEPGFDNKAGYGSTIGKNYIRDNEPPIPPNPDPKPNNTVLFIALGVVVLAVALTLIFGNKN